MPVYFSEEDGTCSSDVGALSKRSEVQFEELKREGHVLKPLSVSSQDTVYCNVRWWLLALSRVGKVTAEFNIPTSLERQFQWCYENPKIKGSLLQNLIQAIIRLSIINVEFLPCKTLYTF
jgi:hypothetical protein